MDIFKACVRIQIIYIYIYMNTGHQYHHNETRNNDIFQAITENFQGSNPRHNKNLSYVVDKQQKISQNEYR